MLWYFAAFCAEMPSRPFTARPSEPRGATFVFVTPLAVVGSSKSPEWVQSTANPSAHRESYKSQNRFEVRLSHETDSVFPTR